MARKAVLVANGVLAGAEEHLRAALAPADGVSTLLIGVDGGAGTLLGLGMVPDVVTGDFDSLAPSALAQLRAQGVTVVPTPDQNFTDLDKAVAYTIAERGIRDIGIFAATGGRLDHIYSALSVVVKHGRTATVRLIDAVGVTWLLNGEQTLTGDDLPGRTLSLLALGEVAGIYAEGLEWPLRDETLAPGVRDGTLNRVLATTVTLRARTGNLLVMLHHAPTVGNVGISV